VSPKMNGHQLAVLREKSNQIYLKTTHIEEVPRTGMSPAVGSQKVKGESEENLLKRRGMKKVPRG